MPKFNDITGQRFGRLVALKVTSRNQHQHIMWACQCDCGNKHITSGHSLRAGKTQSCGCLQREAVSIHNDTYSFEWRVWQGMCDRCTCPTNSSWEDYGGRGIRMHWLHDYPGFLTHVGRAPSIKHSIDRIDNDGHYEPGNVRWATRSEQRRNRRPLKRHR